MTEDDCSEALWPGGIAAAYAVLDELGIADVADQLGLSQHTIRYYERAGLVKAERDGSGRRRFNRMSVRRLEFIRRMRLSGMRMCDLARYIALVEEGPHTTQQRLDVMKAHRDSVKAQLRELESALAATEYKIVTYGGTLDAQCAPSARPTHDEGEQHDHDS